MNDVFKAAFKFITEISKPPQLFSIAGENGTEGNVVSLSAVDIPIMYKDFLAVRNCQAGRKYMLRQAVLGDLSE